GLLPSIARLDNTINTTEQEKQVIEQLGLMGGSFPEISQATVLDTLVLAQHYGLKTRLLDWTSNPLAALWFACSDKNESDAYVYALNADDLQDKKVYTKDPFGTALTRVFQPRLNNQRIVAQHGWFTLHRYSTTANSFVPVDTNPNTKNNLTQIQIPSEFRADILESLERHGISKRTLFPDLEGLCVHLNWKHNL
ncbi:FRG domain-containing protein, partial [Pseudomonas antarctica]|uniref:FRG domain-containing protein n=1 Tax=Pseudomonas antarctica TaxID=219572 RepID=UPI00387AEDD3